MSRSLVRKHALTPDQVLSETDAEVRLITPGSWFALLALVVAIGAMLATSAVMDVSRTVTGTGAIGGASGVGRVQSTVTGEVSALLVHDGSHVAKGDPVIAVRDQQGTERRVTAVAAGRVVDLLVWPGQLINFGDFITYITDPSAVLVARLLVPVAEAAAIKPGMSAYVAPVGSAQSNDGKLIGVVKSVARSPLSETEVADIAGTTTQADDLLRAGALNLAVVELGRAADLRWTTGQAPSFSVEVGTLATGQIVLKRQTLLQSLLGLGP